MSSSATSRGRRSVISEQTFPAPMFKPILTTVDLPVELRSHETMQLDFKTTVDPSDRFEQAKDVAAFANNLGGTILVGAQEDSKNHRLGIYKPLVERVASEIAQA